MKTAWQIKKLGEIGIIFNGNSINERVKKEKYLNLEEGLPFIATKDIDFETHSIDYENGVKIPFSEKAFKIAHKNSVLICAEGGSAGRKIAFNEKDICFGNKLFAIETNKDIDPKFVYYRYLTQDFFDTFKKQMNGIIGGVSIGNFKNLEIPLPALAEQKRVVKKLDNIFEKVATAKESAEKNLQNSKEFFESYLQSVFANPGKDWEERRLGDLSERVSVGHVGPTSQFYCDKYIGIPFLRSQNVRSGKLDWSGVQYITKEFHQKLKKSKLKFNDILFVRVGANRGDCCVLNEKVKELNCANIVFARLKEGNVDFIDRFCQSRTGKKQLLGMSVGAAQGVINTKSVAELVIPYPSLLIQETIVKKLDALSIETKKLEKIYEQKLADLEELKKSILSKAFHAEL